MFGIGNRCHMDQVESFFATSYPFFWRCTGASVTWTHCWRSSWTCSRYGRRSSRSSRWRGCHTYACRWDHCWTCSRRGRCSGYSSRWNCARSGGRSGSSGSSISRTSIMSCTDSYSISVSCYRYWVGLIQQAYTVQPSGSVTGNKTLCEKGKE